MAQTTTQDLQTQDAKATPDFANANKAGSDTTTLNTNQQTDNVPLSPRDFNSPFSRKHTRLHTDGLLCEFYSVQLGSGVHTDLDTIGTPNGHTEAFKMVGFHADARQCFPRNDTPPHICRHMVNANHLPLSLCPRSQCQRRALDSTRFRRRSSVSPYPSERQLRTYGIPKVANTGPLYNLHHTTWPEPFGVTHAKERANLEKKICLPRLPDSIPSWPSPSL